MKKKLLSILLMIMLLMQGVIPPVSVHAAGGNPDVSLDLTAGDVEQYGCRWDSGTKTLEYVGNETELYKNINITFPGGVRTADGKLPDVTIINSSDKPLKIGKIDISGSGSMYANLKFAKGTISVEKRLEPMGGVNVTVDQGANVDFYNGMNLTSTSANNESGQVVVNGVLNILHIKDFPDDPGIDCFGLKIGKTGRLTNRAKYGIKINDIPMESENETMEFNKLTIESGGILLSNNGLVGICVHKDGDGNELPSIEEQKKMIKKHFEISEEDLQANNLEIRGVNDSEQPGSAYVIVYKGSGDPSLEWGGVTLPLDKNLIMNFGLYAKSNITLSRHEDSQEDLILDTNLEKEWIGQIKVNGIVLSPDQDYMISASSDTTDLVFKSDFLKTLYKPGEHDKKQEVEIEFRPLGKDSTVPSTLKSGFLIDAHAYGTTWQSDDTHHWLLCSTCGERDQEAEHIFVEKHDKNTHWEECSVCGRKRKEVKHTYGEEWKSDDTNHWHECVCGQRNAEAAHTYEWIVDKAATEEAAGSKHQECTVCHHKLPAVEIPKLPHTHKFGSDWKSDEVNHWHECACGAKDQEAEHTFVEKHDKNTHWEECSVCGRKRKEVKHTYGEEWKSDDTNHWHECVCGQRNAEAAHTYEWIVDKAATEDTAGSKHQECTVCHHKLPAVEIPKLPHTHKFGADWKSDEVNHWHECACGAKDQEAKHTFVEKHDKNTHWEECSVCGKKRKEAKHTFVEKHDGKNHWEECSCGEKRNVTAHTYEWIVDKAATEEAAGSKHQECTVCHHKLPAVEIPKLPHTHKFGSDWKSDEVSHWHECACGAKDQEANHTLVEKHDETNHWQECSVCGKVIQKEAHTFVEKHDEKNHWEECSCGEKRNVTAHTYEWIVDKAATEEAAGSKHQECTVCHHKLPAVEIPKLPPSHQDGDEWKSDDTNHWHEGAHGEKNEEAAHTLEWIIDKEATEDAAGLKHQECTVCHHKLPAVEIPKLPPSHQDGDEWKSDDTNHWHEGAHGEKNEEAAHTLEWIIDKEATEDAAGVKHQECTVCHHKLPAVEIPKLPPSHQDGDEWKSDDTSHWHEGAHGEKNEEAAHTLEWIIDKEATEDAAGVKHQECTVCHHKLPAVEIPKLPPSHQDGDEWKSDDTNHWHEGAHGEKNEEAAHTLEWIIDKEATEDAAGLKHQECTVCHHKLPAVEIPKLPPSHQDGEEWKSDDTSHWHEGAHGEKNEEAAHTLEWIIDKEATTTETGMKHQHCTVCGYDGPQVEIPMEKPKYNIYKVVQGAEQIYNVSRKDGALFKINGPYKLFKDVYVDGVLVDPSGYVSKEGSTIIHFTKEYMNTLALGKHTFKAEYIDGEANTTFTIVQDEVIEKPEEIKPDHTKSENVLPKPESETPKTGDSNHLAGYILVFAGALIIAVLIVIRRKRK